MFPTSPSIPFVDLLSNKQSIMLQDQVPALQSNTARCKKLWLSPDHSLRTSKSLTQTMYGALLWCSRFTCTLEPAAPSVTFGGPDSSSQKSSAPTRMRVTPPWSIYIHTIRERRFWTVFRTEHILSRTGLYLDLDTGMHSFKRYRIRREEGMEMKWQPLENQELL